jgi:hypothetical protein
MRPYKGVETLLAAVAGRPWLELTLAAVRCRYVRINGLAILPVLDEQDRRQRGSHASEIDLQPTKSDVIRLGSRTRYVST